MDAKTPRWYEAALGALLLLGAAAVGVHLVLHPEHDALRAWGFVAAMGMVGLWLVSPVTGKAIWREARRYLPWDRKRERRDEGTEDDD